MLGKDIYVKPDVSCEKRRFGTSSGGWDIVPHAISRNSVVYSFGVGFDASFDIALIEAFDLTVHAFDPTPQSIDWARSQHFPRRFVLHEYGIAAFDGMVAFNPPENPGYVSHTLLERPSTCDRAIKVPVRKLQTIMRELGHLHIDVLKMDVEGAEYQIIADLVSTSIRPSQILVEFHHRFASIGPKKTKQAINTIKAMGYRVFSVSSSQKEFGFLLTQ